MEPSPPAAPSSRSFFAQIESFLELYLVTKAPWQLPIKAKDFFVKFAPWANIIGLVFLVGILLPLLGLSALFAGIGFGLAGLNYYHEVGFLYIGILIDVGLTVVLSVMAAPGLFKHTKFAWRLSIYQILLRFVYSVIFYFSVGGILGTILSLYFWFQIKEYYKN